MDEAEEAAEPGGASSDIPKEEAVGLADVEVAMGLLADVKHVAAASADAARVKDPASGVDFSASVANMEVGESRTIVRRESSSKSKYV